MGRMVRLRYDPIETEESMGTRSPISQKRRSLMEGLEPRLLLCADGPGVFVDLAMQALGSLN